MPTPSVEELFALCSRGALPVDIILRMFDVDPNEVALIGAQEEPGASAPVVASRPFWARLRRRVEVPMGVRLRVHEDIEASEGATRKALEQIKASLQHLDEVLLSDNLHSSFNDEYIEHLTERRSALAQVQDQLMRIVVETWD